MKKKFLPGLLLLCSLSSFAQSSVSNTLKLNRVFFVQSGNTAVLAAINESSKSTVTADTGFRTNSISQILRSSLYLKNTDTAILADGVLSEYNSNYSKDVNIEDAPKFTNINENLAILRDGHLLSIERRPLVDGNDTVFFNLTNTSSRDYRFKFDPANFSSAVSARLEDGYLQTSIAVSLSVPTIVDFKVEVNTPAADANRFRVVYKNSSAYYRSVTSGTWNSTSTWESSADSAVWYPATATPDFNAKAVTIQNGHTVTVTANVTIPQTTVLPAAALSVASGVTLTVASNALLP